MIDELREYVSDIETTVGDAHTFLGVNYVIDRKRKVVTMEAKRQIQEALDKFPEKVGREVNYPS